MFYKWGVDGSGSQRNYNQHFQSNEAESSSDSSILLTSVVPLQLHVKNSKKRIIWQNPRTSSTRFCRPIKLEFIKETTGVLKNEFQYIENQIANLSPTKITVDEKEILIYHELFKTMVDGKVCTALSATSSSQKCYICKAGPSQFNNLELVTSYPSDPFTLDFGISPLHTYIRSFETFLHISYRLEFKVWQVRKPEHKILFNIKKKKK